MNRIQKGAVNGAFIGGTVMAMFEFIKQYCFPENSQQKINWERIALSGLKGAAIGAVAGGAYTALVPSEKKVTKQAAENLLANLLTEIKLNKNDSSYQKLDQYANEITYRIEKKFRHLFKALPVRTGSTENGTALMDKFDIDVFLSFRNDSFRSTEEMFYEIGNFLDSLIGTYGIVGIREQRKSFGLEVNIQNKLYKIDIIPCKITHAGKNRTSGYLYVNNADSWNRKSSYTKTDINLLKTQRLNKTQKDILVILKKWKTAHDVPISSHLLQNLIVEAYCENRNCLPPLLCDKVIMVMKFIAGSLHELFISSVENTNNIVTDIPDHSKRRIVEACEDMINRYKEDHGDFVKALKIKYQI